MSGWLYQMSERVWASKNYQDGVKEGRRPVEPRRTYRKYAKDAPAPGDLVIFFYAPAGGQYLGICGIGYITGYVPKTRRFHWLPLPPTNILKRRPWWDERVKRIVDRVRGRVNQGTMFPLSPAVERKQIRGLFAWAQSERA